MCLVAVVSNAQGISGRVIDEQSKPMPFANVVLLNRTDSVFIVGAVTKDDGTFTIETEKQNGLLKVTSVGYIIRYINARQGNMGDIQMQPDTQMLGEVVVKGSRPLVKMKDDALVTTVEGSYLSKTGTAGDVLGKIPGVISNHGSVEVIGRGTPLIYINGRQMRNQSELDQLSSDQIKDVEVVMTPGAKYDATVKAVIRIKTIRPVGEGLSLNSRTMAGLTHYVYGLEELNVNYRHGGLDIFGMAEYENRREKYRNSTVQDTWLDSHYEQQSAIGYHTKYKPLEGKVGFDYMLGDNSSLGVTYTVSSQNTHECNEGETTLSVESALVERTVSEGSEDIDGTRHLVNAYYSGNLGKWSMDANADMLLQRLNTHAVTSEQASTDGHRDVTTDNGVRNRLYAVKVVAAHPLWKGEVELGTEGSYVRRTDVFNNVEGIISAGDTKIEENSTAAFVQLTQRLNKLTLMAGLRYEYLDSRYYESGVKMDDESRTYSDLFPSLMLMYPLKNVRARLSYSRNINRPAFDQLSGNVVYINRYTYESGNPYLKPSYRDNLSLALNYKWLTGMIDYARVHDYIITSYSSYQDDPTIALLRKDNVSGFDNLSLMVSAAPTFGKYHPQLMVATQMQNLEVQYRGETKKMNSPMAIVRFNNAVNLPFDSWLNADFSWRSAGDAENMRLASSWQFDISLYKAFWNDRLSVKLACTDLFSSIRQNVTIYNDVRQMYLHKHLDTRNLELTVRYNFNPAKSKYRGQGAGNDVKNRF